MIHLFNKFNQYVLIVAIFGAFSGALAGGHGSPRDYKSELLKIARTKRAELGSLVTNKEAIERWFTNFSDVKGFSDNILEIISIADRLASTNISSEAKLDNQRYLRGKFFELFVADVLKERFGHDVMAFEVRVGCCGTADLSRTFDIHTRSVSEDGLASDNLIEVKHYLMDRLKRDFSADRELRNQIKEQHEIARARGSRYYIALMSELDDSLGCSVLDLTVVNSESFFFFQAEDGIRVVMA